MLTISFMMVFFFIFVGLLLGVWLLLVGDNSVKELSYFSMFECGYDCDHNSRLSFSLHFFFVVLLFIVFDMEILLLISLIISGIFQFFTEALAMSFFLLMLILLGLVYEWCQGCLDWL